VQKVSAAGAPVWTAGGVAVCTATRKSYPYRGTLVSDGAGGLIVGWWDFRAGASNSDIYAQRVLSTGTPAWTANGVPVCVAPNNQEYPVLVSDGASGAIVVWTDYRTGAGDIYAQRLNASGLPEWTADGTVICSAAGTQNSVAAVSDLAGGMVAAWVDTRNGNSDIYAQRINASGVVQWTADGIPVCTQGSTQIEPAGVTDGLGGMIVGWRDTRYSNDIFCRRVTPTGSAAWIADGIAVCTANNNQLTPHLCTDGAGGAIIVWYDNRISSSYDIFAQRIFRQDDNAPSRPVLVAPPDGGLVGTTTPLLDWADSVGATAYRVEVDDTWFRNPEVDVTGLAVSAYSVSAPLAERTYYWRVTASNATGSSASDVFEFTVDTTPPPAPALVSPPANGFTTDTPEFDWDDVVDPDGDD
jgi:hypothetical protein